MQSPKATWSPRPLLNGLLATLALVIAPHTAHLPLWLSVLTTAILGARYWMARQHIALPRKWLLYALAIAAVSGVILQYKTVFGREAGVALLTLMMTLKLLEVKNERDVWLIVFLGYFMLLTHFLYNQSLFIAAYLLLVAWLFTTLLIAFSQPRAQMAWRAQFKLSAKLLLQSVPVMLVLFFLFPRISGPLWNLPSDVTSAQTGLSDSMAPGMISQLAQSDSVAFRVEFAGKLPPSTQRYFRVLVMDHFDGYAWRARRTRPLTSPLQDQDQGPGTRYTITLEPHNKPWLPVMDFVDPASLPIGSQLNSDFSVTQRELVERRKRYSATSHASLVNPIGTNANDLSRALDLPATGNPRTRALAQQLRSASRTELDFVNQALARFHNEPYVYTLRPPRLGANSIDEFLFDTRRGFCEHYASSFTYLMRAGGVPARIVTGYLSGEYNQLGNYLIVRQADAHAWSEVWLTGRGWVRIDPTAAVAPNRIEQGIANALPAGEALFLNNPSPWLRQLKFSWDTFNNSWNQWVLGYDQERQVSFFARLGFGILSWEDLSLYLLMGVGSIFGLLAILTLRPRSNDRDNVERTYALFCKRLGQVGIARDPAEGPLDFALRAKTMRPDLAPTIEAISRLYVALRYGANTKPEWVQDFSYRVTRFRARKPHTHQP